MYSIQAPRELSPGPRSSWTRTPPAPLRTSEKAIRYYAIIYYYYNALLLLLNILYSTLLYSTLLYSAMLTGLEPQAVVSGGSAPERGRHAAIVFPTR